MTKTTKSPERGPAVSRRSLIMAGAAAATFCVGATLVYSVLRPEKAQTAERRPRPRVAGRLPLTDLSKPGPLPELVLGKTDAPVTIYEYADLACPACAAFHTTVLPKLKEKYIDTGKARIVFREFPIHTTSVIAFMTMRCVEPARAFPLISALFSHQDEWGEAKTMDELRTKLFTFAQQVGLTRQEFDACVPVGGKTELTEKQQKLLKDISDIRDRGHDGFGVNATPTFFVNGKKLVGAALEDFDKAIADQASTPPAKP